MTSHASRFMNRIEGDLSDSSSLEELVPAYIARCAMSHERGSGPNSEVLDLLYNPFLSKAIMAIKEWSKTCANHPEIGFVGSNVPEIALEIDITSRGNLQILWYPMISADQYSSLSDRERYELDKNERAAAFERSGFELVFLRNYMDLEDAVLCPVGGHQTNKAFLARMEMTIIQKLLSDLPERLRGIAKAYWQDHIEVQYSLREGAKYDLIKDQIYKSVDFQSLRSMVLSRALQTLDSSLPHKNQEAAKTYEMAMQLSDLDETYVKGIQKKARDAGMTLAEFRNLVSGLRGAKAKIKELGLGMEDVALKNETAESRLERLLLLSKNKVPVWFGKSI